MQNNINILKFGGAALKNREGFERLAELLRNNSRSKNLAVISAFSTSTRELAAAARIAERGELAAATAKMDEIIDRHSSFAAELIGPGRHLDELNAMIAGAAGRLRDILRGVSITRELTARTRDAALSFGELFALWIIDAFLVQENIIHAAIDAAELIVTDSRYGSARPLPGRTAANVENILLPAVERRGTVVTQGFVARSLDNEITTMGIESSNLTAILLAGILGADSVTFYTDVGGILDADPEIIPEALRIERIDYGTAYRAALSGLKLIYPPMIEIARRNGIAFVFRNAFDDGPSTTVAAGEFPDIPPIIVAKEGLFARRFTFRRKPDLETASEYLTAQRQFELFSQHTAPPDIFAVSEDSNILNYELPVDYTSVEFNSINAISIIIPNGKRASDYSEAMSQMLATQSVATEISERIIRIYTKEDAGACARAVYNSIT